MKRMHKVAMGALAIAAGVYAAGNVSAENGVDGGAAEGDAGAGADFGTFETSLSGYEEVPSISTTGQGSFSARVEDGQITYELSYADLEAPVLQAHVHLGQRAANGGISVFLCTNLDNGPADTPPCPPAPATVTGALTAEDVVGPSEQGIEPGELGELLDAMVAGVTYVNVHSETFPAGEIRGQLRGAAQPQP